MSYVCYEQPPGFLFFRSEKRLVRIVDDRNDAVSWMNSPSQAPGYRRGFIELPHITSQESETAEQPTSRQRSRYRNQRSRSSSPLPADHPRDRSNDYRGDMSSGMGW